MRGTPKYRIQCLGLAVAFVAACGGSATPAEEPEESFYDEPAPERESTEPTAEAEEEESDQEKPAPAEPEFKEGMSVNDAINAVPQGTVRANIDEETLSQPLKDFKVYEPCKPAETAHWTIRVAVWNGRAVGVDITTKPANQRLSDCIAKQVKEIEWAQKVPSLNTVEYSY